MTPLMLFLTTMGGCFAGSIIPVINTEMIIFAASAAAPTGMILPLIIMASIAQMIGKSCLYYAGSGLLRLPRGRFSTRIDGALARVNAQKRASGATLFASATVGLPPFFVVSIASGALGVDFRQFFIIGFLGRTIRFCAIAMLPQLIKAALEGIGS